MSKVAVTKNKLDYLANAISAKSGESLTLTIDDMIEAVDGIETGSAPVLQSKTYTVDSAGTETITADSGYDGLSEVEVTVPQGDVHIGALDEYYTDSGARKWHCQPYAAVNMGDSYGEVGFIADEYMKNGDDIIHNAVPTNTTITPTESAQTIGGANYMMEGAVTVNAISSSYVGSSITRRDSTDLSASGATVTVPSGYYASSASKSVSSGTAGTPTATKGTVSNHSVSVTPSVTNTEGYISGGTKTGTAVTVSASELVSGTYTVDSSGTKDVTNYASASVPSVESALSVDSYGEFTTESGQRKWTNYVYADSDGASGWFNGNLNHTVTKVYNAVPANTTITPTISSQTIGGSNYMMEGAVTVSGDQNLSASNIKKNVSIFGVTGTYEGGGGTPMHVEDLPDGITSVASSISFTGLSDEPKAFWFMLDDNISTGTPSKIAAVVYDGTDLHAQTITNTSNAQVTYDGASLSKSYSNGTLTITSSGASFVTNNIYYGAYVYGGGAIDTKDVQVGSGATSITFTGLEDEPETWSCIFKSNFSTSSGYQRTIYVGKTENGTSGFEMDSAAHNAVHWTSSYSNGSFTITSQGTNVGGYFHQPGYYQLTYAYDDGSGGNYQTKSVTYTPSTTQQTATIQADSGYDALKKVNITVNAMTSMTLPTTSSAYSSGTFKATITPTSSAQYINIPVGYNSTAQYYTISAASGGGSASIGSKTLTPSNRPTSIQFTSMSGSPKAFTLRCTAAMSRSSNSSYYYVAHIRYNGTNTYGNCWRMSNGNWTNITSGYSFSYSGTTLTITSSGSTTTSPGCFYPGEYELVYIY